ncbi:PAX-interacting protein 1-like [Chelonus insularis]|uniref:PAX-interacting protein 1-like n=1 Tax=Chelonus insularis TaxID=460826 RepID=UPI00158D2A3D|nr:PAX-interacting protein 1-like [Chelonus insularis]
MGDIRAGLDELKLDVALFADVKFYVSGKADPKVLSLLDRGGAERSNYFSALVTHLIAGHEASESDISEAKDLYEIPAVTQKWVLESVKSKKLLLTKYFSAEENQLFSSVRACVSQVSQIDHKSLWGMIALQGGKCQLRLDRYCTHLIVGKASGAKYDAAIRHHIKIVTPDWVTECCKERTLIDETEYHPRLLVYPPPNSSTAMITGFAEDDPEPNISQEERDHTKMMLEQLKQRMPWNQPNTVANTSTVYTSSPSPVVMTSMQNVATSQLSQVPQIQAPSPSQSPHHQQQSQQQQLPQQQPQQQQQQPQQSQHNQMYQRFAVPSSLPAYSSSPSPAPNNMNQNNWQSPAINTIAPMKPIQQTEQIPQGMMQQQMVQQQLQQQHIQQQQQQQQQQHMPQQINQLQTTFTQQMIGPQSSPQLASPAPTISQQHPQMNQQAMMPQQQPNIPMSPQQQMMSPQHPQIMSPQQKQISPHQMQLPQQQNQNLGQQIIQGNQINQQMQQMGPHQQPIIQQQITQQMVNQTQIQQQIAQQQMSQQQIPQQQIPQPPIPQQQISQQPIPQQPIPQQPIPQQQIPQQQIPQPQIPQSQIPQQQMQQQQMAQQQMQQPIQQQMNQQQLTPEQRQQLLLIQQQQQQKIQQISQQLQQSAPQPSQQFIVREGQIQQQTPNQVMNQNQQSFIVNREAWQQQQYHLQLQRQQQQQQLGPQRPAGQWVQQPPQPVRQLIHLDAQTHQQLQQMDPQQRAQVIQKIQKSRNFLLQRQLQNRQAQQGPHAAVIRAPGSPGQAGLQWVQQRPQIMSQTPPAAAQKPMLPGVQPPALTPINSPNQVIVQSATGAVQAPPGQPGQTYQQGQLTHQQLAQLHMQKQQQMARLQQLHLQQQQQQQQQQPPIPEPAMTPLTPLSVNSQMPPDQQLVVNAKTKTALANMLTNRLQGGAAEGSAAGQLRLMTAQHRAPPPPPQDPALLAAYQRRTLGNITNGAPPGSIKMQYQQAMTQSKAQFYGHNPNLKLPPDLCLLGCIFVIVEYEAHYSQAEVANWKQVIERHGGEVEPQYCSRATHVLAITQKHPVVVQALRDGKRCVNAHWLSDIVSKQQVLPPWHALHFPIPFDVTEKPCPNHNISFSGFEGEERTKIKAMFDAIGVKYTTYFSRHNTILICRKPEGPKYKKAKEWQIPVVNAQWITDILCGQLNALHQIDTPKYQQFSLSNPFRLDYSIIPHLMAAWKMPINITQESYDKVKQVGQGPNAMRRHKKPRLEGPLLNKDPQLLGLDEPIVISNPDPPSPEKQPKILFSGTNPRKHAKRIRELGGALAANWRDATHLVMPAPYRTVKFLCCLSRCKYIVNIQWLMDCFAKNTFLDESSYTLGDTEFEKNFNCNIEKALTSPNRGSVLKGKTFYVTPSVVPSPSAFAEIIESAGGVMEKTRRSLSQIQEMNNSGKLNYIIITQEKDVHLLADVLRANINVYSAEVVLGAICRQNFQIDSANL